MTTNCLKPNAGCGGRTERKLALLTSQHRMGNQAITLESHYKQTKKISQKEMKVRKVSNQKDPSAPAKKSTEIMSTHSKMEDSQKAYVFPSGH